MLHADLEFEQYILNFHMSFQTPIYLVCFSEMIVYYFGLYCLLEMP